MARDAASFLHIPSEHPMTATERLHRLVNMLPEREQETAERVLEVLAERPDTVDRMTLFLALAPDDDEPLTDADRAAIEQARAEYRAGHGVSTGELLRDWRDSK